MTRPKDSAQEKPIAAWFRFNREATRIFLPIFICVVLYTGWILTNAGPRGLLTAAGNISKLLPLAAVCYVTFTNRRSIQTSGVRRMWGLLCAGWFLWTAGSLLRAATELFDELPAFFYILDDGLYLSGYPFLLTGFLTSLEFPRQRFGKLRLLLELAISSLAVITLGWAIFLRPLLSSGEQWAIAYPAADLAILVVLMNALFVNRLPARRVMLAFLLAGTSALFISNLGYASLAQQSPYQSGTLLDSVWAIGYLLLAAGIWHLCTAPPSTQVFPGIQETYKELPAQTVLPIATTFTLVWYTLIDWQLSGNLNYPALWMSIFLTIALVANQGMRAGEIELREYANLVDNAAEPAFICDRRGKLKLVNPAFTSAIGAIREDRLPMTDFFVQNSLPTGFLDRAWVEGWSGEITIRRINGERFPAQLSLRPIHQSGQKAQALAGTFHDLSDQKRQQETLRQAYDEVARARQTLQTLNEQLEEKVEEKTRRLRQAYRQLKKQHRELQSLDQVKTDFVTLVSHELRAPLTNISGGIELVLKGQKRLPESAAASLGLVEAEIHRLNHLVETILDLSALEAGKTPFYPAPLPPERIIKPLQQHFTPTAGVARITWHIPDHLPYLMADERAVTSVLFQLIDNALKYTTEGEISVTFSSEPGRILIRVQDNGPGIPPELAPLLFEKFQRLHSADAQAVYGHGLGLYIARRLLQAMQGDIRLENSSKGALFCFWLPSVEGNDEPQ